MLIIGCLVFYASWETCQFSAGTSAFSPMDLWSSVDSLRSGCYDCHLDQTFVQPCIICLTIAYHFLCSIVLYCIIMPCSCKHGPVWPLGSDFKVLSLCMGPPEGMGWGSLLLWHVWLHYGQNPGVHDLCQALLKSSVKFMTWNPVLNSFASFSLYVNDCYQRWPLCPIMSCCIVHL